MNLQQLQATTAHAQKRKQRQQQYELERQQKSLRNWLTQEFEYRINYAAQRGQSFCAVDNMIYYTGFEPDWVKPLVQEVLQSFRDKGLGVHVIRFAFTTSPYSARKQKITLTFKWGK